MVTKLFLGMTAVLSATIAGPALAQVNPVFDMPVLTMNAAIDANNQAIARGAGGGGRVARTARAPIGRAFAAPAGPDAVNLHLTYSASAALRKEVLAGFLGRVQRNSPQYAAVARDQLGRHDYASIFRGIVAPYGIRQNDLADAVAAYIVLGYMVVNGDENVTPAAVQGVRGQIAQVLAHEARFANPTTRAKTAEEFKILFVTLHAGWQSARREGTLAAYAQGVNRMMQRQAGLDLRRLRIDNGFLLRE